MREEILVEAGGIEPPSETVAHSASTSVAFLWLSRGMSRKAGRSHASSV